MAADILVGLLIGGLLVMFLNPYRGIYFHIREQQKQIQFLRNGGAERGNEYPNRKEDT